MKQCYDPIRNAAAFKDALMSALPLPCIVKVDLDHTDPVNIMFDVEPGVMTPNGLLYEASIRIRIPGKTLGPDRAKLIYHAQIEYDVYRNLINLWQTKMQDRLDVDTRKEMEDIYTVTVSKKTGDMRGSQIVRRARGNQSMYDEVMAVIDKYASDACGDSNS